MHVHLSKELRKKYSHRNIGVRVGDKVKVMRGSFKKQEGKVESVNRKKSRVFITGIERTKRDGAKVKIGIHTSKLLITELNLDDKYRQEILKRGTA